jgi:hypothetical protein
VGGLVLARTHRGLQDSSPCHPGSRGHLRTTGPKSVWALHLLMPLGAEYQREFVRPWQRSVLTGRFGTHGSAGTDPNGALSDERGQTECKEAPR